MRTKKRLAGESLTQQQFADSCNINNIVSDFNRTGRVPIHKGEAKYGDFSEVGTFQESLERVEAIKKDFRSLPAKIRDVFKNNPDNMVQFMDNPENNEKAIELGLYGNVEKKKTPAEQIKEQSDKLEKKKDQLNKEIADFEKTKDGNPSK